MFLMRTRSSDNRLHSKLIHSCRADRDVIRLLLLVSRPQPFSSSSSALLGELILFSSSLQSSRLVLILIASFASIAVNDELSFLLSSPASFACRAAS